jgi:hypothetical protein
MSPERAGTALGTVRIRGMRFDIPCSTSIRRLLYRTGHTAGTVVLLPDGHPAQYLTDTGTLHPYPSHYHIYLYRERKSSPSLLDGHCQQIQISYRAITSRSHLRL